MSTLAELVRARTDLREDDVEWLHRLVAEWQLVADLSFADLVLWARTREDSWLAVAHMRPTTGLTAYPLDVVGSTLPDELRYRVDRAARDGRIARDGEPEWRARVPVRQEAVPVRRGDRQVAVLTRDTNLTAARMPSQLELSYLTSAGELLQMVSEGTFPFPGSSPDPEHAPRVGDGYLRLDRTGHVVYASPNALSAYRRLGVSADLLGAHLGRTIARLSSDGLDEPRGSAALAAVLRFQEPRESEVEAQGATVLLRALPLVTAGVARGAVVLVRDVSELRRRDRQILGKDATIREIHHRVKNNLQTVAALLRLQARRLDEPRARAALEESVRRVSTIAVVHETLSLALDESVLFDAIADRVLAMCAEVAVAESDVRVVRVGEFGELTAEVATPLAMVLTELVQNAVEHAQATTVEVRVQRTASRLTVVVADDGRGLPAGFDLAASTRLGLQIVRTLVEGELRGTIDLVHGADGGTEAAVSVPLTPAP
ncbi:MAG: PAS domain-containing sensor histidine kinase [Actinobacteria bacterium]|nr:PAS domain-containing sensor histidine kinase [Actinomycetota bacterium]